MENPGASQASSGRQIRPAENRRHYWGNYLCTLERDCLPKSALQQLEPAAESVEMINMIRRGISGEAQDL